MKNSLMAACLVLCMFLLSNCMGDHYHVQRADLIGTYEAKADTWISRPEHVVGQRLALRADGTYQLTGPSNDPGTSGKVGHWKLTDNGKPEVELDSAGYPIKFDSHTVELVIDDDINARYQKLK